MKNDKILRGYMIQVRRPFSISELAENTGINRELCYGYVQQLVNEGAVTKVCSSAKPQLYKYNCVSEKIRTLPSIETISNVKDFIYSNKTHSEIAQELGISRASVSMSLSVIKEDNEYLQKKTDAQLMLKNLLNENNIKSSKKLKQLDLVTLLSDIENVRNYIKSSFMINVEGYKHIEKYVPPTQEYLLYRESLKKRKILLKEYWSYLNNNHIETTKIVKLMSVEQITSDLNQLKQAITSGNIININGYRLKVTNPRRNMKSIIINEKALNNSIEDISDNYNIPRGYVANVIKKEQL